jgi:geranylgeranyl reductase family protein
MQQAAQRWDAIVVGGGPAGSSAARRLARGGARTLLLEKQRHPRYKPCGGGLPLHALAEIETPIDDLFEGQVDTLEISHPSGRRFRKSDRRPFASLVMRDRLDARLLDAARDAGVQVHEGEPLQHLSAAAAPGQVVVETALGRYEAPVLIGADGATGPTARAAGLDAAVPRSAAWELEIEAPPAALDHWAGVANIDVAYRPWGYGWVFPKQGRLSVGVVLPPGQGRRIRALTDAYAARLGLHGAPVHIAQGHPVRYRRGTHQPVAQGPLLLAGDAAGLADEFTAEGIHYALRSGRLAADTVLDALGRAGAPADAAARYLAAVNREIQPELDAARAISRMYYWCVSTWAALALRVSEWVNYFWRAFFRVMRGESTYARELSRAGLGLTRRLF